MADAKRAVVVGIDDYAGPKIEKLSGAVLDATEVHQVLTENGGFDIKKEHFLKNAEASSENIRSAISDLFWKSEEKEAIAIFYFAGHGAHDYLDNGYLLPHDADVNAPFVKGISIQELKNLFLMSKINTTAIMILDCCYSGIATRARSSPGKDEAIKRFRDLLGSESSSESKGSGRFILASARADEKAREAEMIHADGSKHVHGQYSFYLIEALRGAAGGDSGQVSLGHVISHIERVCPAPFSAAGSGMDGIWLTNIPEKLEALLKDRYAQIESFVNDKTLRGLLAAIERITNLQSRGIGETEKLENYLACVGRDIAAYRPKIREWWMDNNNDLYGTLSLDCFEVLRRIMTDLTVENFCKHDRRMRGSLTEAVEAAVKGKDYTFVAKLMGEDKPAPRIASANVLEASGASIRSGPGSAGTAG